MVNLNCNVTYSVLDTGRTALHIAAQYNCLNAATMLYEDIGLDINCQDDWGLTPVVIASYYGNSELCAALIQAGARTDTVDSSGITGLMRITFSMPTITREVLDTFVEEDLYKGERSYHLGKVLGNNSNVNTSFYHYVTWIGAMGILDHSTVEQTIEAKWAVFAESMFNMELIFVMLLMTFWSIFYLTPYPNYKNYNPILDSFYVANTVIASFMHVYRVIKNCIMLKKRWRYMGFLDKVRKSIRIC